MKNKNMIMKLTIATIFLLLMSSQIGWTFAPEELLRETFDRSMDIQKELSAKEDHENKYKEALWKEFSSVFDLEEMAGRSLGRFWKERSNEEKKEFVKIYTHLFKYMYLKNSFVFDVEKINFLKEWQKGKYAKVHTKNILKTGDSISVDFLMHTNSGEWNVYDVVIEGLSMVNSIRSQLYDILAKQPYDKLIERLRIVINETQDKNDRSPGQFNRNKEFLFYFIGAG
ncbi:MAG: ABC transporter substrate-binding protein [Candidatus Kuenenia sp.]|nr:ABC transporter substrate-binding protein [Candidatus Kuenenia hertensis]